MPFIAAHLYVDDGQQAITDKEENAHEVPKLDTLRPGRKLNPLLVPLFFGLFGYILV